MTRHEQETVIRFDEESADAIVYTASPRVAKWLDKQFERTTTFNDMQNNFTGAEYSIPKQLIRIKPKGGQSLYLGGTR